MKALKDMNKKEFDEAYDQLEKSYKEQNKIYPLRNEVLSLALQQGWISLAKVIELSND